MSPRSGYLLEHEVYPRLISAIPNAISFYAPEDAQEVIQDGVAMAAKMMDGAEKNGKRVVKSPIKQNGHRKQAREITCGNIAYFTIQKLRCGRRSTGSSVEDVCAAGTQLQGHSRLESMEEVVAADDETGGEIFTFNDVLSRDEEDPATKACRRIDWEDFLAGLSAQDQAIIQFLIEGKTASAMARKLRVSDWTIQTSKRHLAEAIIAFMGSDILLQIQRRPNWRNDLVATKEKLACKHERCH
jgi:hypothetical protein